MTSGLPKNNRFANVRPAVLGEDAGFTLVETLAAFAVLTIVLIVLMSGVSQMLSAEQRAKLYREASRLAQSKVDTAGVVEPLIPGETTGRFDNGFTWVTLVRADERPQHRRAAGVWLEIRVSAPANGTRSSASVSLVTFKSARLNGN